MFQSPDHKHYLSAVRLVGHFDDNKTEGYGTGFIVRTSKNLVLCTARHVVDPRYRSPSVKREASLRKLELTVLTHTREPSQIHYGSFKVIISPCDFLYQVADCDFAFIGIGGSLLNSQHFSVVEIADIASQSNLFSYSPGYPIFYSGYSASSPILDENFKIEDERLPWPVLRQGVTSTPLELGFQVEGALGGSNYAYLDSFALQGFSGAPIFSQQRGWPEDNKSGLIFTGYLPPRLIGMICGHFNSSNDRSNGAHSGISYFLPADRILEALLNAGLA